MGYTFNRIMPKLGYYITSIVAGSGEPTQLRWSLTARQVARASRNLVNGTHVGTGMMLSGHGKTI